jgi:hypothetical protein
MDNLSPGKQFESLLDLVEADQAEWREEELDDDVLERAALGHAPLGPPPPPTSISGLGLNLANGQPPCPASDVRLKEDVQRIGTTVFGLPLYHFRYIGRPETYEGVMAQDVLDVMPNAVVRGEDGYYRVNYSALGTNMRRVS